MKRYIAEGLSDFLRDNPMAWHMPGHKRIFKLLNSEGGLIDEALAKAICMDVTEVPGTDDLYEPSQMIAKSMKELTDVYKTYSSYYLVNGSTGGILAAIAAVAELSKGKVIVAENCHKSVFNGVRLMGLEPIYLSPKQAEITVGNSTGLKLDGDICVKELEEICKEEQISAMILTSPTYEGVISDIQAIANILHSYGALLIVDEAHGAHLPFVSGLPKSALYNGADVVIQSLHKTLPALTQTALLHVNNPILDPMIKDKLQIFMSSSPSYLFLCSMEAAIASTLENNHEEFTSALMDFRNRVSTLKNIFLLHERELENAGFYAYDYSRIVITVDSSFNFTGEELAGLLRQRENIAVEMSGVNYVVLISTIADNKERFDELFEKLAELDEALSKGEVAISVEKKRQSEGLDKLRDLIGKVAENDMYIYPPGCYEVRRGEIITESKAERLSEYIRAGLTIRGL